MKTLKIIGFWLPRLIITAICILPALGRSPITIVALASVIFIITHIFLTVAHGHMPGELP